MRDVDLAEDVVQETMLRIYRHWDQARVAPEAYSHRTMVNVCREHWRRESRRPVVVGESPGDQLGVEEPVTDAVARRLDLTDALRELDELQREVLVMRFLLDLSILETSETLGISPGTVKSSAHRGLEKLRRHLTDREEQAIC